MQYRVEELAAETGVGVDTIRFYQGRGLLPSPERRGRVALYADEHVERLRRIRSLQRQGFTLNQIRKVLTERARSAEPLLAALVDESVGARTLSLDDLASEARVPKALIQAVVRAGLMEPIQVEGGERFSESDLEMARVGLTLLETGFPLQALLQHAVRHAHNVRTTCDAAIDLFDEHVRRRGAAAGDVEAISDAFRRLLPLVTRLVAVHFQRTLVSRALNRLEGKKERSALDAALAALDAGHLQVEVGWR